MKEFSRRFTLDDGTVDLPGLTRYAGVPLVEDNAVQLQPGVGQLVFLVSDALDSREHDARVGFRLSRADADVRIGVMVRAEFTEQSPNVIHRTYLVTLDGAGALSIFSILASDPSPAPIATCTLDLDIAVAHFLRVKVRDVQDVGAEIIVYLDDEVSPVLTHMDRRTLRPMGLYTGFDMLDTVGQAVFCDEFFSYVLKSSVVKMPQSVPQLRNFGDLIYECAYRTDRAGNSQFDAVKMGHYINHAQMEVYRANHPWTWAERILHFTTRGGVRCYELPPWVAWPQHLADESSARYLDKTGYHVLAMQDPGHNAGPGSPFRYSLVGWGDFGQPVIAIDPAPSGAYYIEMPCYAKPIPMVENIDIPLIPPEDIEVLIYGALKRSSEFSDAKTLFQTANFNFETILKRMVRRDIAKRDENQTTRLVSMNEVMRSRGLAGLRVSELGW
jgi:hypothetical protein